MKRTFIENGCFFTEGGNLVKKLVALFLVAGSLLSGCGATTSTTQSTSSAQASSSSTTISESTADSSKEQEQIEKK